MKPYTKITSNITPLDMANVDTDQIIPKNFLKRVERTGFGQFLFNDWRFNEEGNPNKEFILNKPEYEGSQILLARDNFGCGSSREHAPWALQDYGFQVIIAPSYADIFFNNCFQNGILPIKISASLVDSLFKVVENNSSEQFLIDLENQKIIPQNPSATNLTISFTIAPNMKEKLLKGLDDIASTLQFSDRIAEFEKTR